MLYKILPKLEKFPDSIFYPFDRYFEEDGAHVMAVGRFVDHKTIFAVETILKDSTIVFYRYNVDNGWLEVGRDAFKFNFHGFEFEDWDADGQNEVLGTSFPNMNGNVDYTAYYYSKTKNKFHNAGGFFGVYTLHPESRTIHYNYFGSWYAPQTKVLYEWRNEMLIAAKSVEVGLKDSNGRHGQYIEYCENPGMQKDTLVVLFRKTYKERKKDLSNLYNNFFGDDCDNNE
jgi:hypothetical protein